MNENYKNLKNQDFDLVGNKYNFAQIEKWYAEEEAYHDTFKGSRGEKYWKVYDIFNSEYAFDEYFKPNCDSNILSFGCAEGNDLEKLYNKYKFKLYGIEASDDFIAEFNIKYANCKKSNVYGKIDYTNNFFDYISVLGVLHHIPNVSYVLSELYRVLKPEGIMILREPISSMRPTNIPISGLSPNELGIPTEFMLNELNKCGFEIISYKYAYSPPLMTMVSKFKILEKIPMLVYIADKILCQLTGLHSKYQRNSILERCVAGAAYYVVKKKSY